MPDLVNSDHLYLGTVKDNVRDVWERGRTDKVRTDKVRTSALKGEAVPNAVLTKENVLFIRSVIPYRLKRLADEFNVSKSLTSQVRQRKIYKDVL